MIDRLSFWMIGLFWRYRVRIMEMYGVSQKSLLFLYKKDKIINVNQDEKYEGIWQRRRK